jgi:hypothetical protein
MRVLPPVEMDLDLPEGGAGCSGSGGVLVSI